MPYVDRTGYQSGRLTVLCEAPRDGSKPKKFVCQCQCGNETVVIAANLLKARNPTKSCGCLQREKAAQQGQATAKDRSGERIGRLIALSRAPNKGKRVIWHCRCDCGTLCDIAANDLHEGRSTSCGCLHKERTAEAGRARAKHGHARSNGQGGRATTPEYRSFKAMRERCRNENAPNYHLYGGRGISICERWLGERGFENFLADMGPRPENQTLDREDTDGNYEPSNCRWATPKKQAQNRRKTPEYAAQMKDNLDRGRRRMWDDPAEREKLLAARRRK